MNLISDLGNELAFAILIEKKHSEKISSDDILPLIKRLKDALQAISSKNPRAIRKFRNSSNSKLREVSSPLYPSFPNSIKIPLLSLKPDSGKIFGKLCPDDFILVELFCSFYCLSVEFCVDLNKLCR